MPIPNASDLVRSLRSTLCPICGNWKRPDQTMCNADYRRLPAKLKSDLHRRIGQGYEQAIEDSMKTLHAEQFQLPPQAMRQGHSVH